MSGSPIHAVDERVMTYSAEQIWTVLSDVAKSPGWWPRSVRLSVIRVEPGLIGSEMEICPRGGRPFRCRIEAIDVPNRMVMRYPGNFVHGVGEWRVEPQGDGKTRVTYALDVVANGFLAVLIGKILSLSKIHSRAMQDVLCALEGETARRFRDA